MKRIEIFLYVVKGSKDPDRIDGVVPYPAGDTQIFFGPDQTPFRRAMRERFLTHRDEIYPQIDIYIIGVNDLAKGASIRKILWVGRINRIMTFEVASNLLDEPEYESLIDVKLKKYPGKNMSPIHVEPVIMMGKTIGYKHRSDYRGKVGKDGFPEWAKDVVEPRFKRDVSITGDEFYIEDASNKTNILKRDCCFLCDRNFFADGEGLELTEELIEMLVEWQPGQDVDNPGIFGYSQGRDGNPVMNKPKSLPTHIRWQMAERMMEEILNRCEG
ncbi:hypothetical protein KAU08_09295 [bacterium]|nr:hypothetical protein [bacterium]